VLFRSLAEAEDKITHPPPRPFPWARALAAVGVVVLVLGGLALGRRAVNDRLRLTPAEVVRLFDQGAAPLVVDARAPGVYRASPFRIPGAVRVSPDHTTEDLDALAPEHARTVIAYATADDERASARVARRLRRAGFRDVRTLRGGLASWTGAGLPLEDKPAGRSVLM